MMPILLITLQQATVLMRLKETLPCPSSVPYAPCVGKALHFNSAAVRQERQRNGGQGGRGPSSGMAGIY